MELESFQWRYPKKVVFFFGVYGVQAQLLSPLTKHATLSSQVIHSWCAPHNQSQSISRTIHSQIILQQSNADCCPRRQATEVIIVAAPHSSETFISAIKCSPQVATTVSEFVPRADLSLFHCFTGIFDEWPPYTPKTPQAPMNYLPKDTKIPPEPVSPSTIPSHARATACRIFCKFIIEPAR